MAVQTKGDKGMNDTGDILRLMIQAFFDLIVLVIVPVCIKVLYTMAELKTNMVWVMAGLKILGDKSGLILHSPHTPEFDRLIEKFWHNNLTEQEVVELREKLNSIINESEPANVARIGLKAAAAAMLGSLVALHKTNGRTTVQDKENKV